MRRRIVLTIVAVAIAAVPVQAQGTLIGLGTPTTTPCSDDNPAIGPPGAPFGHFRGIAGGQNVAQGEVLVNGWALDDDGVERVVIEVDGIEIGRARYGRWRPDVARLYPGFPDSDGAGFLFRLPSERFLNGPRDVTAVVWSTTGQKRRLNTVVLEFNNSTQLLRPFGQIDHPDQNANLFGTCDLEEPNRRYSTVIGWALDSGVELNDQGVGWVELLIDGGLFSNTRLDCDHDPLKGLFTDCYGLERLDIERAFPFLKDAPNAGFRFVIDVGLLVENGWSKGHHVLTIRSGDIDSQVANIDSINVNFWCEEDLGNSGGMGGIDGPTIDVFVSGVTTFQGWALDWEGVDEIEIYVDGRFVRKARFGFIPRPEISSVYPGFPDSAFPGWIVSIDTTKFGNGEHELEVIVIDDSPEHDETLIGEKRFRVRNL